MTRVGLQARTKVLRDRTSPRSQSGGIRGCGFLEMRNKRMLKRGETVSKKVRLLVLSAQIPDFFVSFDKCIYPILRQRLKQDTL